MGANLNLPRIDDTKESIQRAFDAIKNYLNIDSASISSNLTVSDVLPAGILQPYAGSIIPSGWLNCDGSVISRTTYSRLFTAIGIIWGAGDGSSTFNLPDLRSATLRGVGTPTLYTSNTAITLAQTINDKLQGHYHQTYYNLLRNENAATTTVYGQLTASPPTTTMGLTNTNAKEAVTDGTNGTPRVGLETTGKARGVYYIIKY